MRQKAPTNHSQQLSNVVLYEDDIVRLMAILNMSGSATVSLEHGDFIYDTLEELRNVNGDVIRELQLTGTLNDDSYRYRRSYVSFDGSFVYLHFDATHELAFRQARDYLIARRPWKARLPTLVWYGMLIVVSSMPMVVRAILTSTNVASTFVINATTGALIVLSIAAFWFLLRITRIQNLIYLKKRYEHSSFVKRHESTIVKALFGLVGSIIGYLFRIFQE